jgi:diketogulonate reductase-like aldo/keto reductase
MQYRAFANSTMQVPVIGQGTWYLESAPDAVATLRHGLDLGLCHIDTAEMYGNGAAETIVGKAIAGRREEVFLVSKVLPGNASRSGTIAACERSLRHLDTDYLDVYLLHWPGSHPLEDTLAAFESLRDGGKIRAFGVSNFDLPDLEELAGLIAPQRIACNQVLYNPLERTVENEVLPWCRRHGIRVVAYSPFNHGPLPGPDTAEGRALEKVARRHGVTAHQVALAFVTRHEDVFAIPKAARRAHVSDNAAAASLRLQAEDLQLLDAALPRSPAGTSLPML